MIKAIAFICLCVINFWGLDCFILPKVFFFSFLILCISFEEIPSTDLDKPALLLLASMIISTLISRDWSTSILGSELMGFGGLIQVFIYAVVFKLCYQKKEEAGKAIVLFSIPMLTYAILQKLGFDYSHPSWSIPSGRSVSTQGNPVFLSMTIGMIVPLVVHFGLNSKTERLAYFWLMVIIAGGLWSAGSRCGWLAGSVGTLAYLCF